MAGLFEGVRVAEISHPLTEYAGALWARLGAEVYLVELPEGGETRRRLPRVPAAGESSRGSMAFLARNAGKRSVVFDADSEADREALRTLCESVDVLARRPMARPSTRSSPKLPRQWPSPLRIGLASAPLPSSPSRRVAAWRRVAGRISHLAMRLRGWRTMAPAPTPR